MKSTEIKDIQSHLIKQLHKHLYQLHITNQIDFISVRLLEKLLLRIKRGLDALLFCLKSPSKRPLFPFVGLLTIDVLVLILLWLIVFI